MFNFEDQNFDITKYCDINAADPIAPKQLVNVIICHLLILLCCIKVQVILINNDHCREKVKFK